MNMNVAWNDICLKLNGSEDWNQLDLHSIWVFVFSLLSVISTPYVTDVVANLLKLTILKFWEYTLYCLGLPVCPGCLLRTCSEWKPWKAPHTWTLWYRVKYCSSNTWWPLYLEMLVDRWFSAVQLESRSCHWPARQSPEKSIQFNHVLFSPLCLPCKSPLWHCLQERQHASQLKVFQHLEVWNSQPCCMIAVIHSEMGCMLHTGQLRAFPRGGTCARNGTETKTGTTTTTGSIRL